MSPLDELREALKETFNSPDMGGLSQGGLSDPYWYAEDVLAVLDDFEEQHPGLVDLTGWTEVNEGTRADLSTGQLIEWLFAKRPTCAAEAKEE
ncbi:MAG: hypothetical protein ABFE13_11965 [Phycisphaerales bacterium]